MVSTRQELRVALWRLISAWPRCCRCNHEIGIYMNADRWWLCATCWLDIIPPATRPVLDVAGEMVAALETLARVE